MGAGLQQNNDIWSQHCNSGQSAPGSMPAANVTPLVLLLSSHSRSRVKVGPRLPTRITVYLDLKGNRSVSQVFPTTQDSSNESR